MAGALLLTIAAIGPARAQPVPADDPRSHPPGEDAAPRVTAARVLPFVVEPTDDEEADRALLDRAVKLDRQLAETARDLGLGVRSDGPASARERADEQLPASARGSGALWIVPSMVAAGDRVRVRIVVAHPNRRVLFSRVENTELEDLPVRAVVMLRDLVAQATADVDVVRTPVPPHGATGRLATAPPSDGRLTLAVNATLFGGLVGYSIQRSSGSDDPRLLYPLLALGAGVGLGGSMLVAEEWNVGVADAWYLSAGSWWPSAAGILIYEGRFAEYRSEDQASEERWTYGLVGGTTGVGLAALGLTLGKMSDGGAVLSHSGGGLGMVLGGLTELGVEGDLDFVPEAGMGYGAALGWASASTIALHVRPTPSRILIMDLGAVLGGLGGAALGSPLLFDEPTPNQQRAWLGITAGAAVTGGAVGLLWADDEPNDGRATRWPVAEHEPSRLEIRQPMLGVIGQSSSTGRPQPIYGVGVAGTLQ